MDGESWRTNLFFRATLYGRAFTVAGLRDFEEASAGATSPFVARIVSRVQIARVTSREKKAVLGESAVTDREKQT